LVELSELKLKIIVVVMVQKILSFLYLAAGIWVAAFLAPWEALDIVQ